MHQVMRDYHYTRVKSLVVLYMDIHGRDFHLDWEAQVLIHQEIKFQSLCHI